MTVLTRFFSRSRAGASRRGTAETQTHLHILFTRHGHAPHDYSYDYSVTPDTASATSELRSFTDDIQMILVSVSCLKTRAAKEQRVVAYTRKSVISDELMCVRAVQRAEWGRVCVRGVPCTAGAQL